MLNEFSKTTFIGVLILVGIIYIKLSSKGKAFYDSIRKIVPAFKEDEVIYPYLKEVKNYLLNNKVK